MEGYGQAARAAGNTVLLVACYRDILSSDDEQSSLRRRHNKQALGKLHEQGSHLALRRIHSQLCGEDLHTTYRHQLSPSNVRRSHRVEQVPDWKPDQTL